MAPDSNKGRVHLKERVQEGLEKAEKYTQRHERLNSWLIIAGIVLSALATIITGTTAASGPVVLEGIPGWRLACAAGAGLGFATTVSIGLVQQLQLNEKASKGNLLASRLQFLDLAIDTGVRDLKDLLREYEEIARSYPEAIRG